MELMRLYLSSGGYWNATFKNMHWKEAQVARIHPAINRDGFFWSQYNNKLGVFLQAEDELDAEICIDWILEDVLEQGNLVALPLPIERAMNEALNRFNPFIEKKGFTDDDLPPTGTISWITG